MNGRVRAIVSTLFFVLSYAHPSLAQPTVSSVSQQTSSGVSVLVVSGSRFGTRGNNNPSGTGGFLNAAWRDFEDGRFNGGNMTLDDRGSPQQWSLPTTGNRPNSQYHLRKVYVNNRLGDYRLVQSQSPSKWFVSFWFKEDIAANQQSGKFYRHYFGGNTGEDFYLASGGGDGLALRGFSECANCSPAPKTVWGSANSFVGNRWHRIDIEIARSPDWLAIYMDGVLQWRRSSTLPSKNNPWEGSSNNEREQWINALSNATGEPLQIGSMIDAPGDGWPANGFYAYDDIYIDYTYARVELGNAATWAACTRREIQIPRQWSDSGITVQLNKGAFANGDVAYLYVVDANGVVNATGYPVTIGSAAPDTTAPTVTSASPASGAANVPVSTNVGAVFSEAMDAATLNASTVELKSAAGTVVASAIAYDPGSRTVTLDPSAALAGSSTYTATVKGGAAGVKDLAGNPLAANFVWSFTTAVLDLSPPAVSMTSPAGGATVTGTVTVSATASDNIGVVGVQFRLDGVNLGAEDQTAPYSVSWNTLTATNGTRVLTAVARDSAGNQTISNATTVVVDNPRASSLVLAYAFEEGSGATVTDHSGRSNTGTVSGATRTASGRFGAALSFDGVDDWVTAADAASLDLSTGMTLEAWVYPTALSGWRTVLMKETASGLVYALYAHDNAPYPAVYVRRAAATLSDSTVGLAQLPLNTWSHVAATFDGGALRLFIDGVQVASQPVSGSALESSGPLRVGGNAIWGEYFAGRIDEIRVYDRALSAAEISLDMLTAISAPDTTAPTVGAVSPSSGAVNVPVSASVTAVFSEAMDATTINGSTVTLKNASGSLVPATVAYDAGTRTVTLVPSAALAGSSTYTASVSGGAAGVKDVAGNALAAGFAWTFTTVFVDTSPPTLAVVSPAAGATVTGTLTVSATASDNVGIVGVQFMLDGVNLGAEDQAAPYSVSWNTLTSTNGTRLLTAVARDAAGHRTVSAAVSVTVANPVASSLVLAFAFEEGSGLSVTDHSGRDNLGIISGATRTAAGRFGAALSFDGIDDWVTVADAASLDLSTGMTLEAWVYPTALSGWRTVVMKETTGGLVYSLYANDDAPQPATYVRRVGATVSDSAVGTAQLPLNAWSHVAATFDGNALRLFVDGVLIHTRQVSGSVLEASGPLRLGGNAIWGEYFAGHMDEVRIYNRALNATEIAADRDTPITRVVTPPSAPGNLRIVK